MSNERLVVFGVGVPSLKGQVIGCVVSVVGLSLALPSLSACAAPANAREAIAKLSTTWGNLPHLPSICVFSLEQVDGFDGIAAVQMKKQSSMSRRCFPLLREICVTIRHDFAAEQGQTRRICVR